MRDFYAGNKSSRGCAGKNWRNEEWNPYVGEEEPAGGCCKENYSGSMRRNRIYGSMEMPELSKKEQDDIREWNGRQPEFPGPGTRRSGEELNSPGPAVRWSGRKPVPPIPVPPRRPMPGGPGPAPMPGGEKEPPRRPMPGGPGPAPMPGGEKEPPRRPMPGRPGPAPERPIGRPMPKMVSEWGGDSSGRMSSESGKGDESAGKTGPAAEKGTCPKPDQSRGCRDGMPYIRYDYENIIEEEQQIEKDLRMLQSMYPEAVREILPYIEEVCDRMEYEGSMMFDEHPDKITVRRLSDEICEQTEGIWPRELEQEPDGVMSMQYQGNGKNPLGELIQILLLQEMHHRRCRHHRCRPHMF